MVMPKVASCGVIDCAYNKNKKCYATSIMVGEILPCCDTFTYAPLGLTPPVPPIKKRGEIGAVEICKVERCTHNKDMMCTAEKIDVARQSCNADCLMFRERTLLAGQV